MTDCCDNPCDNNNIDTKQRKSLWIVFWINFVMFFILLVAGLLGKTASLFADCFDNLGDAVTYLISMWAVGKSAQHKARVALFKGLLILSAAILVAFNIIYKLIYPQMPIFEVMGVFSLLAIFTNGACLWVLWKHKGDDLNMESVWHCSRNDIMTNLSVLTAAGLVWYFNSPWPDLLIAGGLVTMLFLSAWKILSKSFAESRR